MRRVSAEGWSILLYSLREFRKDRCLERAASLAFTSLLALGAGIISTLYITTTSYDRIAFAILLILVISMLLFSHLTVIAGDDFIRVGLGVGIIRKRFRLEYVESCEAVRNRWWYGWGIRKIPEGWLFNVLGSGAIELKMKNGKVYRIGSDEPEKLSSFIQAELEKK